MKRPAKVTGRHRGLRAVHTLVRILLVGALVVLLTLIAMREVAGLTGPAARGVAPISTATSAPSAGSTTPPPATAATAPSSGGVA
jgi:hypothetical protein